MIIFQFEGIKDNKNTSNTLNDIFYLILVYWYFFKNFIQKHFD